MKTETRSRSTRFQLRLLLLTVVMAELSLRLFATESGSVTRASASVRGPDEISLAPSGVVQEAAIGR